VGTNGRQKELQALREKIEDTKKMLMGDTAVFEDIPSPLDTQGIEDLQRISNKIYGSMTANEKLFVGKYTTHYAERINDYLASNGVGYVKGEFTKHIKNIDAAIDRFILDRNIIVYRATDASYYSNHTIGKIFKEKIYYSASAAEKPAEKMPRFNDQPVMLEIRAPKGTKGLYIGDNTDYTDNQMEFLIKRGTKYLLIHKDLEKIILEVVK
jgi:hypothetical protein